MPLPVTSEHLWVSVSAGSCKPQQRVVLNRPATRRISPEPDQRSVLSVSRVLSSQGVEYPEYHIEYPECPIDG
jgi:hypothetical protein